MKTIYLLGSLNCDLTINAPYMPEQGETLRGEGFMMTAGGKGANQAYACGSLGGNVCIAGAVGEDAFGNMLLDSLKKANVNTSHVRRTKTNTGVAMITVIGGDNRIILNAGANDEVSTSDVDVLLENAKEGDLFLTQMETPLPVIEYALKSAKAKKLITIFNPAPVREGAESLVQYCDYVIPNRKELQMLSGKTGLKEGIEALLSKGVKAALVTLGKDGSCYTSREETLVIPAVTVGKTLDTTAAGDTFCGAFAVKLAEGAGVKEAAYFASVCAGITVTKRGAQEAIPTREEAETMKKRMQK